MRGVVARDVMLFGVTRMLEATWRGGPFDGTTIDVVPGSEHFPVYDRGPWDATTALAVGGPRSRPRLCPVVTGPDGRVVIDWDAGVVTGPASEVFAR